MSKYIRKYLGEVQLKNQLEFFDTFVQVAPRIVATHRDSYEYEYVEGAHIEDWPLLHDMMSSEVWHETGPTVELHDRVNYIKYIENIHHLPDWAIESLVYDELTGARAIHGDLNFTNVIVSNRGQIVLIDPNPHNERPWQWRELDEAKMLQSMCGFDEYWYGTESLQYTPFPVRRIHVALLMTHFIRMLPYINNVFARRFIDEAACGHIGCRWCDLQAFRHRTLGTIGRIDPPPGRIVLPKSCGEDGCYHHSSNGS